MYETDSYLLQEVESADPARLIEMLYQRALRDLDNAREVWDAAQPVASVKLIVHAQAILSELQRSLNYAEGGQLAVNLGRLYEYMQYRLMSVVTETPADGHEAVLEVRELLGTLAEAWSTICAQHAAAGATAVGDNLVA